MPLVTGTADAGAVTLTWGLDSPADDVWRHLTSLEHLQEWLGQPRSGSVTSGDTLVVDHGDGYLCTSHLSTGGPGHELDMTWQFPDEPPTRLTLTVATVVDKSDAPRRSHLDLRHTGLGDLTASYLPGWITHLTYFEGSLQHAPLPLSVFWRLYRTHERLTALPTPDRRPQVDP